MFGNFKVQIKDRKIINWPRKMAKKLFIYLLFHPSGVHRETLADWLSASDNLERSIQKLDTNIHSLRNLFEPERKSKEPSSLILFYDSSYSFNWTYPYQWDVDNFNKNYKTWQSFYQDNIHQAVQAAESALSYYEGILLPEIDFADDWIVEREAFNRQAIDMALSCSRFFLNSQEYPESAEIWVEKVLQWDNCNEQGYLLLMKIATKKKDKIRLTRIYKRIEDTLLKEISCSPSSQIQELYKNLLSSI